MTTTTAPDKRLSSIHWLARAFMLLVLGGLITLWTLLGPQHKWLTIFITLFFLRYTRLFGHSVAYYLLYRPTPISDTPVYTNSDVTVILPTIDPTGPDFDGCIRSIILQRPAKLVVSTVGATLKDECRRVLQGYKNIAENTILAVTAIDQPSKRNQIAHCLRSVDSQGALIVNTAIVVSADDHVFWPSPKFMQSLLAPFDNPDVGIVGTHKIVRRTTPGSWSWASIVNFIAVNYLQRHSWELRANNAIDGGVFVVSGRTAAYRREFLADKDLLEGYVNERFFFGLLGESQAGGLQPDDDNYITRAAMKKGWLIRFQYTEDATIETTLGLWPKLLSQMKRWAATTIRSNPVLLRTTSVHNSYTWTYWMVLIPGITNFAIIWDTALILSLLFTLTDRPGAELPWSSVGLMMLLVVWILTTKVIKIIPSLLRHPADWWLVPAQIAFSYIHSFIKLWALLTFYNADWAGRNLDEVNADNAEQAAAAAAALGEIEIIS